MNMMKGQEISFVSNKNQTVKNKTNELMPGGDGNVFIINCIYISTMKDIFRGRKKGRKDIR